MGQKLAIEPCTRLHEPTGIHCEGGIWGTLFGLLLWDVLFMEVPGAFRTPFQTSPLDLSTPLFFPARQQATEARLQEIRAGAAPNLLRWRWEASRGVMCAGVNWERNGAYSLL